MSDYLVFDSDDMGANHVISDMCQSHDCRDMLMLFKEANPKFKATLFAIPGEMTFEVLGWSMANKDWIELAWHGFYHLSNYECEKLTYEEFDKAMSSFKIYEDFFVKGFKAPGWQISDDIYRWLLDNDYWVADQSYNNGRRPLGLPAYVNDNGKFYAAGGRTPQEIIDKGYHPEERTIPAIHTHTWDCVGNGVYELKDEIIERIKGVDEFKFVSEVV